MSEYIEREAALSAQNKSMNLSECRKRLESIPAADVRPVVRGKWELSDETPYIRKHYHPVACSNCHRAGMKKWNYCPNCGAKMEES